MKIEIFYHLYIPADLRSSMWTWWVDEQMSAIRQSGLSDIANVNMCITMPLHWSIKIPPEHFGSYTKAYIKNRYKFVNIINMRDVGEYNIYEGNTLRFLYDKCVTEDCYVLYLHSKGYTSMTPDVSCWRQILNHYCINEWYKCVNALEEYDVAGVKDATCNEFMVSGNFWWANAKYIRSLPNPLDSTQYQNRPTFYPGGPDYRYSFEDWLWSGKPKVFHVVDTKTNHFNECCFLEDLKGRLSSQGY